MREASESGATASAAPAAGTKKGGGAKRWLMLAVQLAVSVGLIFYVVSKIQFGDVVVLTGGERLEGRVVDLKPGAAVIRFRVRGEQEPRALARDAIEHVTDEATGASSMTGLKLGFYTTVEVAFRGPNRRFVIYGFLALIAGYMVSVVRWWMLLRAQGFNVGMGRVFRWTYIGVFFNNVMLGTTGGDVVKALFVARETKDRTRGVVSVFVDRGIGMISLALLAGIVSTTQLGNPAFREAAIFLYTVLSCVAVGACVYFSRRIRALVQFDWWVSKLPVGGLVAEVDKAVMYYRDVWYAVVAAIALSLVGHSLLVLSTLCFGTALGMHQPWHTYYILFPVIMIITAAPISIQGWGFAETIFQLAFAKVGEPAERAVALSLANRFAVMLFSLGGGLCMLRGSVPAVGIEGADEPAPDAAPAEDERAPDEPSGGTAEATSDVPPGEGGEPA